MTYFTSTKLINAQYKSRLERSHKSERKESPEQALLLAIISSSEDGIISKDINGIIMSWNAGAERIFGYQESEVIGKPIAILIQDQILEKELRILELIKQGKSIEHYETVRKTKSGSLIDISLTVSPIRAGNGAIIGASKIVRDISIQKISQRKLLNAKRLLDQVEDIGGLGSWEIEPKVSVAKWSNQMFKLFELPLADQAPSIEECVDLIHPQDRVNVAHLSVEPFDGEGATVAFFRSNPARGPIKYFRANWKIERDADSIIARITGTLLDITEQKKKEQEIIKSERLFRSLMENSNSIIGLLDENLKPIYRPNYSEFTSGYSLQEWETKSALREIHTDDLAAFENCLAKAKQKPGETFTVVYRFRHKNGHFIWLETIFNNLLNDVNIGGIVYNTREITESKNAERKIINLNRTYDLIRHINEAIIRATDEKVLLKDVCRIAVEIGSFKMVWVELSRDSLSLAKLFAYHGHEVGDSDIAISSIIECRCGMGPVGIALSKGQTFFCNDIRNDHTLSHWQEAAKLSGNGSLISLPLSVEEQIVGALTLYAGCIDFFNIEEIDLLEQVALDISFALLTFKKDKIRRIVEQNLILSEEKYKDLFDLTPIPTFVVDELTLQFLKVNNAALTSYGYTESEFLTMTMNDIKACGESIRYQKWSSENEGQFSGNAGLWQHQIKNGNLITVEMMVRELSFDDRKAKLVIAHDISEKLTKELEIKKINSELRDLSAYLQNVREQERRQIARDIHDELGQQLTGLMMNVHSLTKNIIKPTKVVRERIMDISLLIDDAVKSVKRIASDLRPSILDDLGLTAALKWQSSEIENRFEIKVNFVSEVDYISLDIGVATNLFRIYQEALTNAVKHANAKQINGKLKLVGGRVVLEVADDGQGMDLTKKNTQSFGVLGIKERVFVIGGECEFKSEKLKGTYLRVSVPVS